MRLGPGAAKGLTRAGMNDDFGSGLIAAAGEELQLKKADSRIPLWVLWNGIESKRQFSDYMPNGTSEAATLNLYLHGCEESWALRRTGDERQTGASNSEVDLSAEGMTIFEPSRLSPQATCAAVPPQNSPPKITRPETGPESIPWGLPRHRP